MFNIKEKYKAFRAWQERPYQVAPMSDESHECATCGTQYKGNYCPRCGQSARIGRYSFVKAFLLFLDVWGLGNRGMFRSIRDLLLRPGYMIRDYLRGMQMAYFPPFKMFFLIIALSLLVDTGFNIFHKNQFEEQDQIMEESFRSQMTDSLSVTADAGKASKELSETTPKGSVEKSDEAILEKLNTEAGEKIISSIRWMMKNQSFTSLIWLLFFSAPMYLFFRRSPAIPDISYSEFFVGMVYTSNMMNIITVVGDFFCIPSFPIVCLSVLMSLVSLKQLSGYGFWRTFFYVVVAYLSILLVIGVIIFLVAMTWAVMNASA